jgi:hypothetical protein
MPARPVSPVISVPLMPSQPVIKAKQTKSPISEAYNASRAVCGDCVRATMNPATREPPASAAVGVGADEAEVARRSKHSSCTSP